MSFAGKELSTPGVDVGFGNDGVLQQSGKDTVCLGEAIRISWTSVNKDMDTAHDWNEYH